MTAAGGSGVINVGTTTGCAWRRDDPPWITVRGSSNASGSANYTVAPNTTTSSRSGTISIDENVHDHAGGRAVLRDDQSDEPKLPRWRRCGVYRSDCGDGLRLGRGEQRELGHNHRRNRWHRQRKRLVHRAAPHGTQLRSGTLSIANQTFTVTQSGSSCEWSSTPASLNIPLPVAPDRQP